MSKHLERLNTVVKLQLGNDKEVSADTARALAQEVINDRYRKIIKENLRFEDALELIEELSNTKKRGK